MTTKQPMGRRKFLRDSAICVGAGSLLAGTSPALNVANSAAAGQGAPVSGGQSGDIRMKGRLGHSQVVWITRQNSGFEQRFASRELARGLQNLGLTQEPIEAAVGSATPASGDFVFALSADKSRFQNPEAYEIVQRDGFHVDLNGATSQAAHYATFDFL